MMQLENWALVTKNRKTFVTPEMVRNRELHIQNVIFMGEVQDENNPANRRRFKSDIVKMLKEKTFTTETEEIALGKPSEEYAEFAKAVKDGMPIVINWVIGKNDMISANLYENGEITYFSEKIVQQDVSKRILVLENGKTVYVVWRNMNGQMRKHLLAIKDWMDLRSLFVGSKEFFQMDVFETSKKIWAYRTIPYEWIFNSPNNFSILNEDIRRQGGRKNNV